MKSIWTESWEIGRRDSLKGELKTQVAVIGAGMAGILIAHRLQNQGVKVVVLEENRIGSGQTGNTTAKITSQHGAIYSHLLSQLGERRARLYAEANQQAVEEYRKMIAENKIDCDYQETCAYLYGKDQNLLREEAEAARRLGLPAFFEKLELPFPTTGGVKFTGQGQFHPLKFLDAVSRNLTVYEQTKVKEVKDHLILTDSGIVRAEKVVFACHFPFRNIPGFFFAKMHQERSCVLALKGASFPDGMYIGVDQPAYSFRKYRDLLLFGGEGYRTGENESGGTFGRLRQKARDLFPNAAEVAHWSAQDCMPLDSVPYIGLFSPTKPDWYVATGFQKWGMSSSMVSAMILSDLIQGKENPYSEVFSPSRSMFKELPKLTQEGGRAVKSISKRIFLWPELLSEELEKGHGGVVLFKGEKVGAYRDQEGKLHIVEIRCPHLGCQLEWNQDELSWDCPCHGSRFDYHGKRIDYPAQEDLSHELF